MSFYKLIILIFVLILASILFGFIIYKRIKLSHKSFKFMGYLYIILIIVAIYFNPLTNSIKDMYRISHYQYHPNFIKKFKEIYKKPVIKTPKKSKNIVYIYLESFSRNFTTKFKNLTPNINSLKNRLDFTNINQIPYGASITIEGLFASACGYPYSVIKYGTKKDEKIELTNAKPKFKNLNMTCANKILKSLGYYTYFIKGGNLEFQNAYGFLKYMRYDKAQGKDELLKRGAKNLNEWGIDDDDMLEIAFDDFLKLSQEKDKFLQVILNIGMHVPNGFVSKKCKNLKYLDGLNSILNATKCTDFLVADFINKIKSSKYSKNTIIVIQSDHLMPYALAKGLNDENMGNSKIFFTILDDDIEGVKIIDNHGSSLDTFTTLLGYMGISDEMNLGRNILKINSVNKMVPGLFYQGAMGIVDSVKYEEDF
ncbi:sulfatase-like hydrolase/transferase [Campylobacter portucalensis]|nr:sulfatase-like hydrolase/transferase [Campylobacter portucalensis]